MSLPFQGIAAVYILTSQRTLANYAAIWDFILSKAPGIGQNLRAVICDFEPGLISSVGLKLPWVTIRGCWFHWIRVSSETNIFDMTLPIFFLPASNFSWNFTHVIMYIVHRSRYCGSIQKYWFNVVCP